MRPGTRLEILQAEWSLVGARANDGRASVTIPDGPPAPDCADVRQLVCPKPPLRSPLALTADSGLATAPFPFHNGTNAATSVDIQASRCSRCIQVGALKPGADVILEGTDGGLWPRSGVRPDVGVAGPPRRTAERRSGVSSEVAARCEINLSGNAKVGLREKP